MSPATPPRVCPRDRTPLIQRLVSGAWGQVTIDACGRCGGIWFDPGELEAISDSRRIGAQLLGNAQKASAFKCLTCGGGMALTFVKDFATDVCTSCLGVWLDADELDKVIAMQREERALPAESRVPDYRPMREPDWSADQYHGPRYRRPPGTYSSSFGRGRWNPERELAVDIAVGVGLGLLGVRVGRGCRRRGRW